MKLKKFIVELEKILETTNSLDEIDVRMADNFAVMDATLKDKTVFITDVVKNGLTKKCKN